MDLLLPYPLTFCFSLSRNGCVPETSGSDTEPNFQVHPFASKGSVLAHEMTPMEVMVRNNTKEMIKMSLSITCRDVAGENCVECTKATVLCSVVLSGITVEVPPLQEIKHSLFVFSCPG